MIETQKPENIGNTERSAAASPDTITSENSESCSQNVALGKNATQIVIGLGEIGSAIQKILGCDGMDLRKESNANGGPYQVLHICFPYGPSFIPSVRNYQRLYKAQLVVVHSTVPVGTCDPEGWVHSPVRGIHPHLEEGIRTFTKFFGGDRAHEATPLFRSKGVKTMALGDARTTEALKLWDTTIYGWNILLQKAIKDFCDRNDLDFAAVYKIANLTYNDGYEKLGHPEYQKFVLKDFPGPIGGHCVRQNWELLGDDPIAILSKELHKKLTGE